MFADNMTDDEMAHIMGDDEENSSLPPFFATDFDGLCKTVDKIENELSSLKSAVEEEAWNTRALIIGLFLAAFVVIPFLDYVLHRLLSH